jgi:hypothetical protein
VIRRFLEQHSDPAIRSHMQAPTQDAISGPQATNDGENAVQDLNGHPDAAEGEIIARQVEGAA